MALIAIVSSVHPGYDANEIARRHQWRSAQISNPVLNLKAGVSKFFLDAQRREVLGPVKNLPTVIGLHD